jgi:two-component system response regulator AtoC
VGSHQPRFVDVRIISATNRDLSEQIGRGRFRSDLYFRLNGVSLMVPPLRERTDEIVPLAEFFVERCALMMGVVPPTLSEKAKTVLLRHRWSGNVRELKNVIERAVVLTPGAVLESTSIQVDMPRMSPTSIPPPPASVLPPSSSDGSPRLLDPPRSSNAGTNDGRSTESKTFDTMSGDRGPRSTRSGGKPNPNRRAEHLRVELARAERDRIIEALQQAGNQAGAAKLLGISRRALIYRLETYEIPRPRKGAGTKGDE